jgi:hypothetical protein
MPSISATASCGPLLTLDDTIGNSFSTSQGGVVGGRSFEELAGKAVTDALQLLAEIAYERAQAKGFALVQAQAIDLLCTRLLWPPRSTEVVHPAQYRWLLPQSGTGSTRTLTAAEVKADDRILPNSCEFVQRARIQDIASRGKDALQALERDILYIALRGAEPSLVEIEPAARAFVRSASQALLELLQHSTISARTPQLLLTQASRIAMDGRTLAQLAAATATTVAPVDAIAKDNEAQAKKNQFNHDAYVCGLKLAFAAMAQCHASDNCDVRLISQLVNQPWEFFSDGTCLSNKTLKEVRDLWPDLELLVARGMEVIGPMPGASPLQMLRDTMDLTLELAARSWAFVGGDIEPKNRLPFAYLRDLREVADALIDRAPQHALVAASGVVERVFERYRIDRANFPDSVKQSRKSVAALRRATGILTAILTLVDLREMRAAESDSPEAGKSREANRDARKKAMESLIDSATDRSNREREWVASFGAAVGGFGGGQWIGEANGFRPNWMYPQLALPIGFSLQYLPPSTAVGVGFSASLTFADLGQYIAYKKDGAVAAARWDTFFAPGLQVGAMIGTSSTSFMLTLDGRYAPTLYTERESGPGAFRLGLGLTYFVPFWDFN